MTTMETAYLAEACRYLILLVLVVAAWTKMADIDRFATSLVDHFRVTSNAAKPLATAIVATEGLAGALVLSGGERSPVGVALALLLLVVFTGVIVEAIVRKRQAYCSCFGRAAHPVSPIDLVRNTVYILACSVYLLNTPYLAPIGAMTHLALLLAAALSFLISIHASEIWQLLR